MHKDILFTIVSLILILTTLEKLYWQNYNRQSISRVPDNLANNTEYDHRKR